MSHGHLTSPHPALKTSSTSVRRRRYVQPNGEMLRTRTLFFVWFSFCFCDTRKRHEAQRVTRSPLHTLLSAPFHWPWKIPFDHSPGCKYIWEPCPGTPRVQTLLLREQPPMDSLANLTPNKLVGMRRGGGRPSDSVGPALAERVGMWLKGLGLNEERSLQKQNKTKKGSSGPLCSNKPRLTAGNGFKESWNFLSFSAI